MSLAAQSLCSGLAPVGARSGPGLPTGVTGEDCGTPGAMAGASEIPGVAAGGCETSGAVDGAGEIPGVAAGASGISGAVPGAFITPVGANAGKTGASGVVNGAGGVALGAAMPSNSLASSSVNLSGSTSCLQNFGTVRSSTITNKFPPDTHAPTVLVSSQRKPVSSHNTVLAPCKAASTGGLAGLAEGWSTRGFSSCAWLLKTLRSAAKAKSLYLVIIAWW